MSRSTTKKSATAPAAPTTASGRASAPLRRRSTTAAANAAHLTSQRIAADVAAFKKSGGRIEVLGNTPLRPYTSRSTTRKATKVAPKTTGSAKA